MHPELDHEKIKKLQQSKEEPKSTIIKFFNTFISGFKQVKNYVFGESNKQVPSLSIYLNKYLKLLTGKTLLNDTNPMEVVVEIVYIFQSLHKYHLHYDSTSQSLSKDDIKKVLHVHTHNIS